MKENSLKVLVVDDDEDDNFLVKEMLKEGLPESKLYLDYATKGEDAIALINNGGTIFFFLIFIWAKRMDCPYSNI